MKQRYSTRDRYCIRTQTKSLYLYLVSWIQEHANFGHSANARADIRVYSDTYKHTNNEWSRVGDSHDVNSLTYVCAHSRRRDLDLLPTITRGEYYKLLYMYGI